MMTLIRCAFVMAGLAISLLAAPSYASQASTQGNDEASYPIQTVTATSTTSDCVGDLSKMSCVVDTWMTCLVQDQDEALCEEAGWKNQYNDAESYVKARDIDRASKPRSYQIVSAKTSPEDPYYDRHYAVMVRDFEYQHDFKFGISLYSNGKYKINSAHWPFSQVVGEDYPTDLHALTATSTTSDCIGDLSDPVCAAETWLACAVQQAPQACEKLPSGGVRWKFGSYNIPSEIVYQIASWDENEYIPEEGDESSECPVYKYPLVDGKHRFATVDIREFDGFYESNPFFHFGNFYIEEYHLWFSPVGWLVYIVLDPEWPNDSCVCPFPDLCEGWD